MPTNLYFFFLFFGSFVFSYILLPKIRSIAKITNFSSTPNHRSSHTDEIPNIGGVAFYVSLMMSFYFIQRFDEFNTLHSLLPGLTILFIIGLKDDLVVVAPTTKLIAQIAAGVFLVFHPSFELLNLKGFLWIFEIDYFVGLLIVIFINVLLINALNLIDGIDGLATIVSVIIFFSFGIIFFFLERYFLFGICLILIGSLLAFLRFNILPDKKIFMGDTGSMLIGFLISIMTIRLIALPNHKLLFIDFPLQNIPFLIFGILSVPLLDLLRVFVIRIIEGRSPFSADRLHFHHVILDYFKFSHLKVSILIGLFNLLMIFIFFIGVIYLSQIYLFGLVFLVITLFFFILNKLKSKSL